MREFRKKIFISNNDTVESFGIRNYNYKKTSKVEMNYQEINRQNLPKWIKVLKYLTDTLKENDIKYYLSGSGLEYILGSNTYPYDIDLFMQKENVQKTYKLLKDYSVSDVHKWEDKFLEFQGEYNGIPFEICEWEKEPKELINKKFKNLEVSIILSY